MTAPDPRALEASALAALSLVSPGMTLGLGTGRAAEAFLRKLGEAVRGGLAVRGVPTSRKSEMLARAEGIPLVGLDEAGPLDLAIDGADEVSPSLDLTKGLGGALLRERVVAAEALRFVVLVTPEKLVARLGERTAIPIEVVPFALSSAARRLARRASRVDVRHAGCERFVTDNGNAVVDVDFGSLDAQAAAEAHAFARSIPGVVDTGLFLGMAWRVIVGEASGTRVLERER